MDRTIRIDVPKDVSHLGWAEVVVRGKLLCSPMCSWLDGKECTLFDKYLFRLHDVYTRCGRCIECETNSTKSAPPGAS